MGSGDEPNPTYKNPVVNINSKNGKINLRNKEIGFRLLIA